MNRAILLTTLALSAIVFGARDASAAFIALVPTGDTPTTHSYDLILDTEGSGIGAFDAFVDVVEVGCPGCIVGVTATDAVSAATGMFSSFFTGGNSAHWGGFSLTGLDVGPLAGVIIGTIQVDHVDSVPGGGDISILIGPDPPSSFVSMFGPLPNTTCPSPASGCQLAGFHIPDSEGPRVPEPTTLALLGLGLAGLGFTRRKKLH